MPVQEVQQVCRKERALGYTGAKIEYKTIVNLLSRARPPYSRETRNTVRRCTVYMVRKAQLEQVAVLMSPAIFDSPFVQLNTHISTHISEGHVYAHFAASNVRNLSVLPAHYSDKRKLCYRR